MAVRGTLGNVLTFECVTAGLKLAEISDFFKLAGVSDWWPAGHMWPSMWFFMARDTLEDFLCPTSEATTGQTA